MIDLLLQINFSDRLRQVILATKDDIAGITDFKTFFDGKLININKKGRITYYDL